MWENDFWEADGERTEKLEEPTITIPKIAGVTEFPKLPKGGWGTAADSLCESIPANMEAVEKIMTTTQGASPEEVLEKKIQDKGLTAPRLTPEDIDKAIKGYTYTNLPSGKCVVCEITLQNGYTVRGESACVSVANFDPEIGNEIAFKNARDKIWQLEGYLLQEKYPIHES